MYIQPNTNVHIFRNVPLCESYEDTMDFSSRAQQWSYFADNYYAYGLNKYSYQRAMLNSIKVEKKYEDLYNCNYLAFNNISYGDKLFYAFIKELKYINDNVTEIIYEIDPLQTWMFDYQLGECFVEREHTRDDSIGANLVPENLETGDYDVEIVSEPNDTKNLVITLFCTVDENYADSAGVFDGRTFSGLCPVCKNGNGEYFDLNSAGAQRCANWIQNLPLLKTDAIKLAVIMPKYFANRSNYAAGGEEVEVNDEVKRIDGTNVRNNKCLCYPYNFMYVSNNNGSSAVYNYEYFVTSSEKCQFLMVGDMSPNPSVMLVPLNYKGVAENYDEAFILNGYPQVAFNINAFKAWLAQNIGGVATSALTMAYVGQMAKVDAKPGMGAAVLKYGGIHGVISGVVHGSIAAFQPPQSKGTQQGSVQVASGTMNFMIYNKRVRPEFATIIDDYFQMFGYACRKVKTPTAHNRIKWDYVKTIGCVVHGNLPSDEAKRIKNIYDNGVRFWHYGATMYDYDTDNNVVI